MPRTSPAVQAGQVQQSRSAEDARLETATDGNESAAIRRLRSSFGVSPYGRLHLLPLK